MKQQLNVRVSIATRKKIDFLTDKLYGTQTETIAVAVDRLYQARKAIEQQLPTWQYLLKGEREKMDKEKMIEKLEQELYLEEKGFVTAIEVFPGGTKDGLDYGPVVVKIVMLDSDGDTIAFRTSTDSHDEDWQVGSIEDAVDKAISYYEQTLDTEKLVQEEWKLQQADLA